MTDLNFRKSFSACFTLNSLIKELARLSSVGIFFHHCTFTPFPGWMPAPVGDVGWSSSFLITRAGREGLSREYLVSIGHFLVFLFQLILNFLSSVMLKVRKFEMIFSSRRFFQKMKKRILLH